MRSGLHRQLYCIELKVRPIVYLSVVCKANKFFSSMIEFFKALDSPPLTTNISQPSNGVGSSSGSHHPTTLHQTSNDSSVRVPVFSTPIVSLPPQGMHNTLIKTWYA